MRGVTGWFRGRGIPPLKSLRGIPAAALLALPLLVLSLLFAPPAEAQTARVLVSNTGAGNASNIRVFGNERIAQAFATGANSAGYNITSLHVRYHNSPQAQHLSGLTVTIRNVNGANPGSTVLGTFTNPNSISAGLVTFNAPAGGIDLAASTTYFVQFAVGGGADRLGTFRTRSGTGKGDEDNASLSDWSIADDARGFTDGLWEGAEDGKLLQIDLRGTVKTAPTGPAAPMNLQAVVSSGQVELTWDDPSDDTITKYQYQQRTPPSTGTWGNWTDISNSDEDTTDHTVTGLTNGTEYEFGVRAVAGSTNGTAATVSATPVPRPEAPTGLTATAGNQQVVLRWTDPSNASITGYAYQQRTAGSSTWGNETAITPSGATTTTHTVTGLTNYTEYEFRLRAINPAGGTNSDAVSATPRPANAPGPPTNFTAVAGPGGGQVTLSWTRPSGTITRYEYRARRPGASWFGWADIRGNNRTTFVASVGNEPLEFQMRARNGSVRGVLSAIVPATAVAAPAAPTGVTATAGNAQVTLSWGDPSNSAITKYQYRQKLSSSSTWGSWTDFTGGTTATSTSGTVTGLTNGTAYDFEVRATAATGGTVLGAASASVSATPAAVTGPAAPTGFTIDTGDTEITLKWTDPNNDAITKYQYRQGTGPLGSITWLDWTDIPASDEDTTEYKVTGLTNGTPYYFQVRAVAGTVDGTATRASAITPVAKPAAPTGLRATGGATQVTLSWTNPSNATITGYEYRQRALNPDSTLLGDWGNWMAIANSDDDTTSHAVTGLTNYTRYDFQLRAVGLSGNGTASQSVGATPRPAGAPDAPRNFSSSSRDAEVELEWADPSNRAITKYQYRQGTSSLLEVTWGAWTDIPASDANTTEYTVTGLTNGTRYLFEVRAVAGTVFGVATSYTLGTPAPVPDQPAGLSAAPGDGQVTLSWDDPSDSTIFHYFYQVRTGSSWGNLQLFGTDSTTTHTVTGLTNGTEYGFRISAANASGNSPYSTVVTATPLAATAPGPPRDLRVAPGSGQVVLNWRVPGTNADAITKYEIRQGTGDPLAWGAWGDASGTTTSHTVTGLTNGTEYSFQVRAVANTVLGAMSDTVEATPNPVPAAPTNFTATKGTASGAIALSWTAPSGTITRYEYRLRPVGGDWPQSWTRLTGLVTSFMVGSQTDGTEYEIELRAVNDSGAGAAASATATPLDPTAAAAPTSFTATAGSGQVDLAWTAPSGTITKYQVRQGTGDPVMWGAWADITGTTRHTVTSLTNGTEYSFQVRAVTGTATFGAMSATATATPTAAPGVTISVTDATVSEADRTDRATFTVVLNTEPSSGLVVVSVDASGAPGLELDGPDAPTAFSNAEVLTFTTTNWNSPRTIRVRATSEATDNPSGREETITWTATATADTDYQNLTGDAATVTVVDNDPTTVTLAGAAGDVAEGATKTFTVTLGRGLVDGETLGVPLAFTGTATRGTDYMTACPTTLPTGVTCNDLDDTSLTPTVTFTGPTSGATARTVTLTLSAASDNTTETGGETVIIGLGTLNASSGTGLEGGASGTDSLADFKITDPDASVPTVAITGIPAKINNTNALTATFTFSEAVTDFVKADITVTGGTAGTFSATSTTVYTLGITPDGDANVVVTVAADSATDGTNTGPASAESATAVWDETAPTVEITGVPGKISNRDAFTVTFTFSESVTDFVTGDVSVTNGDKSAFSGSGSSYTVVVTPNADADVTVTVAAGGATDGLNTGPANAAGATAVWDETAPTVDITGIPAKINNTNALTATFTFSESVTGFVKNDITVTGGTAGAFGGSGTTYTLAITPASGSNVVVTVAANSATDGTNMGPASAETATATWDASVPTVGITGVPARISGTGNLTATFTFGEAVTDFDTSDVTVTGGTKGTFTESSSTVYTLVITPDGDANVVVTVAADSATDGLNTGPASAETATAVWTALVFNPAAVTVVEEATATYTVELSSQPDGNVTVTVAGASGEVTFDTDSTRPGTQTTALTFTTTTWDDAQTVTVLAAADGDTANDSATLTHTASGGGYGSVTGDVEVTVTDNDTPGLVLDPTALTVAEGDSGTYTVALATQPTGTVTVTVAGASGEVTFDTNTATPGDQDTLEFTTTTWSTAQTVTVSAGEDNDTANDSATLTHSASGGGYGSVTGNVAVTVTDDDTAGVTTATTDATATEGSTTDTAAFTVELDTRPSSDVTVTVTAPTGLTLDGPDSATTFTGSEDLTFTSTNWSTAQTVTVRATDDNDDSPIGRELTVTYAAASSDSGYSGLSGDAATVTVVDNDPTTVTLAGAAGDVVEGGTKTFTITLNRGLVNGETLGVPLTFGGDATRNTDYTTACPDTLPTGVTCNNLNTDTTPTVTFTGPTSGATATTVTLTLTAATDNTAEASGESVVIGLGTLNASSGTGLGGGASGTDSLADFKITDPDASAPTLEISGVPKRITTRAAFTVTFTFSESVTDFVKNDITVTGGTAGTFSATSTTVYTLGITPDGDANVVVTVAADSATDGTNTGPPADVVATAVFGAPAAPSVTATAGNAAVTLRWTDPRDDTITGYEFRQGVQSSPVTWGSWTPITNSDKGTTSHTVTGLTDGTEYYFQVRAVSDAVMGEPSAEENPDAVVTPLAMNAPAAPMGLTATAGDTEVDLNWAAPGGTFTGYQVQQGTGDPVVWGAWTALSGTGTSHTVTGLTNGTAYSFRVRAVNSAVLGAATDPATATPRGAAGVTTTQPVDRQVTEGDTADTATFTVELDTPPSSDVTLTVTAVAGLELDGPDPGGTFGSSEALTFTSGNWSTAQTVTVRATDDSVDRPSGGELPVSYLTASSDSDYNSLLGAAAVVTVTDNDPTAVTLAGAAGDITEGGTKDFTVTLGVRGLVSGETLPVPLAFTGGATRGTDYTVACPTSLPTGVTCNDLNMAATPTVTFTGPSTGETERTVTLTLSAATDNTAESGGETVVIGLGTLNTSSGTGLEGGASGADNLADFRINDPDANAPTVAISVPARISNTNALTAMFTFSEPVTGFTTDDVAVAGGAKGTFTATSPRVYTLGITPSGGANVVVTVAANAASAGTNTGPASAQTATALWAALVFNPTSVTVVEESTATYTVELSSQPDGNVTVAVAGASGEVAFDTDSDTPGTQTTDLTFTTTNWDDARTVTVLAAADNDTADDSATLTHTASGGGYGSVSGSVEVTVTDNDTAGPVLDPTAPPVAEGDVVVAPPPGPTIAASDITDTGAALAAANVPGGVWHYRRTQPEGGECSGPQSGESAVLAGLMAATEYAYGLYADSACANELASVGFTTGPSTNAALAGLALATRAGGAAALAPAFSPEADTYSASLPFAADSALLTPRTAHPDATARVGPPGGPLAAVPAQGEGAAVPLSVGVNAVVVEVTAADGATKRTVTLSITRAAPGPLDATAATSHLFPLFADGGGFRSRLLVAHAAGGRARCELALHGAGLDAVRFSAEPMSALPPAAEPESEAAGIGIRLAAGGGGVALNSAGAGELAFGHAKLDCDGPVSAQLLLSLEVDGALSVMAHQSPAERGRAFSLPGLPAPLRLGLAFANDGVRGNLCVVEAAEGRGVVAVPPGGTAFRLLDEIVPSAGGDGGTGPVAVRCDRPAALLAVPLAGGAFTTLAPAVLDADGAADGSAGRRSLLPLALDGGGFRSRLSAVNLAAGANRCELRLSAAGGLAGANFGAAADGPEGMDGFALALAGRGAQESLDSRGGEAFAFGHAALECEGPAALWNLIVLEGPDGPAGMMALGPAQPAREMRFRAPPAPARLGLAIANGGGARTACHVALAAADGRAAPPAGFPLISVPARATAIRFLDEMFAVPADFAGGAATLRCDHPVGAVAVPVAGAAFTAVPPIIPGLETAPEATVDSGGDTPGGSQ